MRNLISGCVTGFIGCLVMALMTFTHCQPGAGCVAAVSLMQALQLMLGTGLGAVLLVIAWFQIRELRMREQWIAFACWVVPLLLAPPLLSKDAYAYADQGHLVLQNYDPYTTGMGMIGGPFATQVDSYWVGTTTVYPSLALIIQALIVKVTGAHPYWTIVAMRIPALLGAILVGLGIPDIANRVGRNPRTALWGTLVNPLLVIHFVGGAHNDSLATGLAVVAVWLAIYGRDSGKRYFWLLGAAVVGLAMGIKQTLGLSIVAVALVGIAQPKQEPKIVWKENWKQAFVRLVIGCVITVGTFVGITLVSGLGFGWATGTGAPFTVGTNSPSYLICAVLAYLPGTSLEGWLSTLGTMVLLIGVAAMAVSLWKRGLTDPVAFLGWGLSIFVVASPSLQPWYLMWGGVFLAASRLNRSQVTMMLTISICAVMTSIMQEYGKIPIGLSTAIAVLAYYPVFKLISRKLPHTSRKGLTAKLAQTGLEQTGLEQTGSEQTGSEQTETAQTGLEQIGVSKPVVGPDESNPTSSS